ncbi:hypothetical protein ACI1MP_35745 [Kitasatospora griseola]|uniref:hypothetical protein n=1 Tax=Kitasatospora griseola TaxID=2064 RepID=UPI0038559D9C
MHEPDGGSTMDATRPGRPAGPDKPDEPPDAAGPDGTDRRPDPDERYLRSGNSRLSAGCGAALTVAVLLFIGFLGFGFAYGGATDFTYQAGWRGTPHLRMTVDHCDSNGRSGRNETYSCSGHGEPRTADPAGGYRQLPNRSAPYALGTELEVSCLPTGRCVEFGTDRAVGDSARFLFGLWLLSLAPGVGLALLNIRRTDRFRRAGEPVRNGLSLPLRLGFVWFAVLPGLAAVLGIVSVFLE